MKLTNFRESKIIRVCSIFWLALRIFYEFTILPKENRKRVLLWAIAVTDKELSALKSKKPTQGPV